MAITVHDDLGRQFIVGHSFAKDILEQPLVVERKDIYSFPFGNAEIVQLGFAGIYIVYGDMCMQESRKLHFEMPDVNDLVEMHFTLAGNGSLHNEVSGKEYQFKANEHNIHYTPQFVGTGNYNNKEQYKFFEVHFTTRFFFQLAKESSPMLMQFAEKIESGKMA